MTGEVDVVSMRRNVRSWLEAPLSGLVLFGSTGEGLLLDEKERVRLLAATREVMEEQLLLAGTGAESTRAAIRLSRAAAEGGADAVLVHPPSYYRPAMTAEALRDHFTAVADASPVPVVLYQVPPQYNGVEVHSGLLGELSRHPNIAGIKDSTGDLKTLAAFVDACGKRCAALVGSGAALFGALEVGAKGGILALALLAPRECATIYRHWTGEDPASAGRLQERLAPAHRTIVGKMGVAGVKAALDLLGMAGGAPRSPLKPLREEEHAVIRETLTAAGLLEGRHALPRR
ncbi:4-hydroxy-tetrahydrodipicolinate synthase [soil metagenome]